MQKSHLVSLSLAMFDAKVFESVLPELQPGKE
jgi:hypothetical protein